MRQEKQAALLLVGHGSSRVISSRQATLGLADTLRQGRLFVEVQACFCKEAPFLSLDLVSAPTVYVVPVFAGSGLFTRQVIPERLGLSGPLTHLGGRDIYYTAPVGDHPAIPALLAQRALALCAAQNLPPAETTLLLIGHGSSRPGAAARTPERVAAALRRQSDFGQVVTCYMEQAPRVADWPVLAACRDVIAAPLLLSEGMHAGRDLPPLFGLTTPQGGPATIAGHRVWLLGGIGRDAELAKIVIDLVLADIAP